MRNKKAIAIASLTIIGIVILIVAIILVPALTAITGEQMLLGVVFGMETCVMGFALYFVGRGIFRTIYEKVAGEKW